MYAWRYAAHLRTENMPTTPPAVPELEQSLQVRFGVSIEQMREQIKPLFMFMLDHGMTTITIDRDDKKCLLTVDGKQL